MRNRSRLSTPRCGTWPASLLALSALLLTATLGTATAQPKPLLDTFTATTTGMTPTGLGLKVQIIAWSDEAGRADVLATLDDKAAFGRLPTVGYVWPAGSPVGYTVKYAHRTPAGSGERVTLVTDKPLGSYDFKKWSATGPAARTDGTYSVVEFYLGADGQGAGNLSLGAEVVIDESAGTISLASGPAGANLLENVKREPIT